MSPFEALTARLTARAAALAQARLERHRDAHWWRRARLLWPLFANGQFTKG